MPEQAEQQDNTQAIREQSRYARWREAQQKAKAKADKEKKKKKEDLAKKMDLIRTTNSKKLKLAWLSLIPTGGGSILYVHAHIFLGIILGDYKFCKLGEEWTSLSRPIQELLRILEIFAIIVIDLLIIFIPIAGLSILIWIITNPLEIASIATQGIYQGMKSSILSWF